jgi:hypothetical protein
MNKRILYLLLGISINSCHGSLDILNEELLFAHLTRQVQTAFLMLEDGMPHYAWTSHFKKMCDDIRNNNDMLPCSTILLAINESLHALALQNDALPINIKSILQEYKEELTADDLDINNIEFKSHKAKKICKLCTEFLTVTNTLKVNGSVIITAPNTRALATALTVNGPEIINGTLNINGSLLLNGEPFTGGTGATGATGPAGATGATGAAGTSSASYGQLSITSSQTIAPVNNSWTPVPFNSATPSFNMTVSTTSPATITIQQAGVYQIQFSVYFTTEYSVSEGIYSPISYLLGISTNGGSSVTPVTAVYASEYNETYALNYTAIMELSAYESIQFYIKAATSPEWINRLVLENGSAYLMQVSN